MRILARGIKARPGAFASGTRRTADDAGVDESASRGRERIRDASHRSRGDCVAIHEDRFQRRTLQRPAKTLGNTYRLTWRDDRQNDRALSYQQIVIFDDFEFCI